MYKAELKTEAEEGDRLQLSVKTVAEGYGTNEQESLVDLFHDLQRREMGIKNSQKLIDEAYDILRDYKKINFPNDITIKGEDTKTTVENNIELIILMDPI
jgi:hypothetical protein